MVYKLVTVMYHSLSSGLIEKLIKSVLLINFFIKLQLLNKSNSFYSGRIKFAQSFHTLFGYFMSMAFPIFLRKFKHMHFLF